MNKMLSPYHIYSLTHNWPNQLNLNSDRGRWHWESLGGIISNSSLLSLLVDSVNIQGAHPSLLSLVSPLHESVTRCVCGDLTSGDLVHLFSPPGPEDVGVLLSRNARVPSGKVVSNKDGHDGAEDVPRVDVGTPQSGLKEPSHSVTMLLGAHISTKHGYMHGSI
jgi:hypothetical protein